MANRIGAGVKTLGHGGVWAYQATASRLDTLRGLPPESRFVRAAARGDLATVQEFLAANDQGPGIDPNIFSLHDHTNALLAASANVQSDVVKALLDAGARTDTRTAHSQGCLHLAASADLTYAQAGITISLISYLLAAGADPRAQDDQGREPFVCAAQTKVRVIIGEGMFALIEKLLAMRAYLVAELACAALCKETDQYKRQALANKMKDIEDMGQSFQTIAELVATSSPPTEDQKRVLRTALKNPAGYVTNFYRALCVHKLGIDGVALTQGQAGVLFNCALEDLLFGIADDVLASCPQHASALIASAQTLSLTDAACVQYLSVKAAALAPAATAVAPAATQAVPHHSNITPGMAGGSPPGPVQQHAMV